MKFVDSKEIEISIFVWKKLNDIRCHDVITHLIFFNSTTHLLMVYLNGIPKFSLMRHKKAEIYSSEVNRELWRKKGMLSHCDLDLEPKVTNFNSVWASMVNNHLAKTASEPVHQFGWNCVHKKSRTHRHTDRHTDKLQWKYNPSMIAWRCNEKGKCLVFIVQ